MYRIDGVERHYGWGSRSAIPALMGRPPSEEPVAELWFGAHPSAPARLLDHRDAPVPPGNLLQGLRADPEGMLGEDVTRLFGVSLPFLLKLIAPARPLSLQVHPSLERARQRFMEEEAGGLPIDSPQRNYRDPNHKPEMVYALTQFEAVCGFRSPRRAAELFAGLGTALTDGIHHQLRQRPNASGMRAVFTALLSPQTRPEPAEVAAVAAACARRLAEGSPSRRADGTVVLLQSEHPGDPGVVASMLLNPVTLNPGEALFVPAGGVHAYLSGLAVEVMASSDNVLRAGLTNKHVDVQEMIACVDWIAAPPIRLAPEHFGGPTGVFYAPVDDFELSVVTLTADTEPLEVRGRGPRIVLCVEGSVELRLNGTSALLHPGEAVFIRADSPRPVACGQGRIVQADVP